MQQQQKIRAMREKKPKRSSNAKVVIVLFLFFTTILIILFFNSPFSKIATINIEGTYYVDETSVGQALGVVVGDQFFAVSSKELEKRVLQIDAIQRAIVSKAFPGKVDVHVQEFAEVGYVLSPTGERLVILANGKEFAINNEQIKYNKPILTGWRADDPIKAELSITLAAIEPTLLDDISEIKPIPSESYPDRIKLYTRSYFEVITAVQYLEDKLSYLDEVINELYSREIYNGTITMLLADTHAPFEAQPLDVEDETETIYEID